MKKVEVVNTVNILVENKHQVRAYIRGQITKEEFADSGIKLVKPF